MRTLENVEVTRALTGIREVGEDFADRIDEIHGLYDDPVTSLSRVPGKLLMSSGIAAGPIWSLHQLRFSDTIMMLSQEGPNLIVGTDPPPLSGRWYPPPDYPDSSEDPQIQAADWPTPFKEEIEELSTARQSRPPSYEPASPYDYQVSVIPRSLDLECCYGAEDVSGGPITLQISGTFPALNIFAFAYGTGDLTGRLHLQQVDSSTSYGSGSSSIVLDFRVTADVGGPFPLDPGSYSGSVIFEVAEANYPYTPALASGDGTVGVSVQVNRPYILLLGPNPTFSFIQGIDTEPEYEVLVVRENRGKCPLAWYASGPDIKGVTISPASGVLDPGQLAIIVVTADPNEMDVGEHSGILTITDGLSSETRTVIANLYPIYTGAVQYILNGAPPIDAMGGGAGNCGGFFPGSDMCYIDMHVHGTVSTLALYRTGSGWVMQAWNGYSNAVAAASVSLDPVTGAPNGSSFLDFPSPPAPAWDWAVVFYV